MSIVYHNIVRKSIQDFEVFWYIFLVMVAFKCNAYYFNPIIHSLIHKERDHIMLHRSDPAGNIGCKDFLSF